MRLALTALLAIVLVNGGAVADVLSDGDFEVPDISPSVLIDLFEGDSFGKWVVVGPSVTVLDSAFTQGGLILPANTGDQFIDVTGFGVNEPSGVEQNVPTTAGHLYELSFHVGNIAGGGIWGTTSSIEVLIDGVSRGIFTNSDGSGLLVDWKQFSMQFEAVGPSTSVEFRNRDGNADNANFLDTVSFGEVGPVVPSMGASMLLAFGLLLGVVLVRLR